MKSEASQLVRAVGFGGAVMMGMGSIVGTGVFVSLGLAAGLAGTSVILALFIAGLLAVCNGLSSAQLAAAHPVSGGTYEYGYRYLHSWLGFFAGWLFVLAKSASAATAALGFGGYFSRLIGIPLENWHLGLLATFVVTLISLFGIKRSSAANILIVSVTLISLLVYVIFLAGDVQSQNFWPFFDSHKESGASWVHLLEASALMFVAYTGYGRIATLGAEIKDPVRNIPKAIIVTLGISFVLYMLVAVVSLGTVGPDLFYQFTQGEAAPLEVIAQSTGHSWLAKVVGVGAVTAMLGVLLNLVLGVSRVIFAMGGKQDLPQWFRRVGETHKVPYVAVISTSLVIAALVLLKDVRATWSFSAFTVLFYYALTNAAALRLPLENRLYPRVFAWLGLFGCLGLSVWVNKTALILGLSILGLGAIWRLGFRWLVKR